MAFAVFMVGLVVVSLFDRVALETLRVDDRAAMESRDWYRMLRILGYLPTWIVLAVALYLNDRSGKIGSATIRRPGHRAVMLIAAPAVAGLGAELFKRLIGRERPGFGEQLYSFKPFLSGFVDDSNLGLPSSHAAVAFGGAFILVYLFPRIWPIAICGAIGCGLSRLLAGAHYLTDVYAAAGLGYAVAAWIGTGPLGRPEGRPSSKIYP